MGHSSTRALRGAVLCVVFALSSMTSTPSAVAAPPSNDSITSAPLLTMPTIVRRNVTDATFDPATDSISCGGGGKTIWYRVRTSATRIVQLDTAGSDYATYLDVYTGTPGALNHTHCATGSNLPGIRTAALEFTAARGVTYFIRVAACCSETSAEGRISVLRVHPRWQISSTVDMTTTNAGLSSGRAIVSGTVACHRQPMGVYLTVRVEQRNNAVVAQGGNEQFFSCGPQSAPWSLAISSQNGYAFRPGPAVITRTFITCDVFRCIENGPRTEYIVSLGSAPNADGT